jgi:hypothetical protein
VIRFRHATLGGVAALVAISVVPAQAYPRPAGSAVQLVSAAANGGLADKGASAMTMTPDGRYVAFTSGATNLVPGDTNRASDVFVRDVRARTTRRVSVDSSGLQGIGLHLACTWGTTSLDINSYGGAGKPAISADGRYVAFASCFTNLVTPAQVLTQIYRHDIKTGKTVLVSTDDKGAAANSRDISPPSISADGRYVVFASTATNLSPKTCTGNAAEQAVCSSAAGGLLGVQGWQVYRHDMVTGKTTVVSVDSRGAKGDGDSYAPFISPDGRYAGFLSGSDNLTADPPNPSCYGSTFPACPQLYLHDVKTGRTDLITVGVDGLAGDAPASTTPPANFEGEMFPASMSANNRYVVFQSTATDLVPQGPLATSVGTYVRDLATARTEMVSVTSTGDFPGANGDVTNLGFGSLWPTISPDGRYVNFSVSCSSWYNQTGAFVHDRLTGATDYAVPSLWGTPTSCADHGSSASASPKPPNNHLVLGADGRWAAFVGVPGAFIKGSDERNDAAADQILLADRGPTLGVGGLAANGHLTISGAPSFARSGVVASLASVSVGRGAAGLPGGDLVGAALAYRARFGDLFFRLDVRRMPSFAAASPTLLYGLDLTVNGARYEVRVAKTGLTAAFELFRLDSANAWRHVSSLKGGYGTTGQSVVFAVPLAQIGARTGGRISSAVGFTAIGSAFTGASTIVDTIRLAG